MNNYRFEHYASVVAAAAGMLIGCGQRVVPNTVEYYVVHSAERQARLKVCKDNPGDLKSDPDCVNAAAAVIKAWSSADMPPLPAAPVSSASSR